MKKQKNKQYKINKMQHNKMEIIMNKKKNKKMLINKKINDRFLFSL